MPSFDVQEYIQALKPIAVTDAVKERIVGLIDLTSLNDTDTQASVAAFCEKARTPFGTVAAVCVYPQFIRLVADAFAGTSIKAATVVNFPQGESSLEDVLAEINRALTDGAQEIDVVFPYARYLAGDKQYARNFVMACRAACGENITLKVIIESGVLQETAIISDVSKLVLLAGANFVKTSTGKTPQGASLAAATAILLTLKELSPQLNQPVGIKISGGIRELPQAAQYIELADHIMGKQWVTPQTFRIGASKLIDELSNITKL